VLLEIAYIKVNHISFAGEIGSRSAWRMVGCGDG